MSLHNRAWASAVPSLNRSIPHCRTCRAGSMSCGNSTGTCCTSMSLSSTLAAWACRISLTGRCARATAGDAAPTLHSAIRIAVPAAFVCIGTRRCAAVTSVESGVRDARCCIGLVWWLAVLGSHGSHWQQLLSRDVVLHDSCELPNAYACAMGDRQGLPSSTYGAPSDRNMRPVLPFPTALGAASFAETALLRFGADRVRALSHFHLKTDNPSSLLDRICSLHFPLGGRRR